MFFSFRMKHGFNLFIFLKSIFLSKQNSEHLRRNENKYWKLKLHLLVSDLVDDFDSQINQAQKK